MAVAGALCVFVLAWPAFSGASTSHAVGVSEREWSVSLGRLRVPHGKITLYITNFGQDDHNIKVRRHGRQYGFSGRIRSGQTTTLTVTLRRPGKYHVFCGIPGHREMGMNAVLTVT